MVEKTNENSHFPRIFTLHSQKGGVGKTSIAMAIAGFSAFHKNKKTLIIDADMTGASLSDMENLKHGEAKKFFNEFVLAKPHDFAEFAPITSRNAAEKAEKSMNHFCWEAEESEGKIYFMPGSPHPKNIQKIVPLISQEDHLGFFRQRLEDILVTATMAGFEVVIIDHSPGVFGLSKSSLGLVLDQAMSHFKDEKHPFGPTRLDRMYKGAISGDGPFKVLAHAIFVTTFESVDYLSLLPSLSYFFEKENKYKKKPVDFIDAFKGRLDIIFNRAPLHLNPVFNAIEEIPKRLQEAAETREIHKHMQDFLHKKLLEIGARAAENVLEFEMGKIFNIVKNLNKLEDDEYGPWKNWCKYIGEISHIYEEPDHIGVL